MPADFTSKDSARADLANLFGFATGFGDRVKMFIDDCLGAGNPFGTAATRDTGETRGQIPVIQADGELDPLRLPPAPESGGLGAVALGNAAAGDVGAESYFNVVTAAGAAAFLAPLMDSISAMAVSLSDLSIRPYGEGDNLRASLVIPQRPALILIASNGGRTFGSASTDEGQDIRILDSAGETLVTLRAGLNRIIFEEAHGGDALPSTAASNWSTNPADTLEILSESVRTALGLRFGMILRGHGAPGDLPTQHRGDAGDGLDVTRSALQSGNGDLLIGMKDETPPMVWLTGENPLPSWQSRSRFYRTRPEDTQGFAVSVRLA